MGVGWGSYLVFEPEVKVRQHVQAGRQESDFIGNNTQLPFFCLARIPLNPNDVPTTQFVINMDIVFLRFVEPAII